MTRVYQGLDGINARLDVLNGRTRKGEERIAVLESQAKPNMPVDIERLDGKLGKLETRINVYAAVFGLVFPVCVSLALFLLGKIWP